MSKLVTALARFRDNPGVERLILLGRDGLVVQHLGGQAGEGEPVAARVPGLASACEALGRASGKGGFLTAVVEYETGVVIVLALSSDLYLAALLRPDVGFAPLLRELRAEREHLIELL